MSRPKFVLSILLVVLGSFLAAFIPTVAVAMRDDDEVSTTELSITQSIVRDEAGDRATAPPQNSRHPSVDPDCYEEGLVCKRERLDVAVAVANIVTTTMDEAGWPAGCFEVRIISGESGKMQSASA